MNELFVNIKVDREERPDLDAIYQHALALMGEQGGWPLTMFLTPDGEPFWGGTYFPPEPRWGRPGFPQVLKAIAEAYRDKRDDDREERRRAARRRCSGSAEPASRRRASPSRSSLDQIAERLLREVDPLDGGIGTAPKFPQCRHLRIAVARLEAHRPDRRIATPCCARSTDIAKAASTIISAAASRATRPTRAGSCRISRRCSTTTPQLVELLTLVWQETRDAALRRSASPRRSAGSSARCIGPEGGFASSLDADSEHEEGKFYVWTEAEIDQVLGERAALLQAILRRQRRRQLGRAQHPQPARIIRSSADDETEARAGRAAAPCCSARASRGCGPGSTTRCWPTGTG